MFPLQPTGFFTGSPLSTKPNAFTISLPGGGGSSATNMANAYDNDPTTYGDLFCPGNPTVYTTPLLEQSSVQFNHSPASGITANSYVTLNANIVAPWSVSSVIKGGGFYPNVYLQIFLNGVYSDGSLAGTSSNTDNIVFVDGSIANGYLSKGLTYSGSFSGTVSRKIGPFSGKTLDVNSLTISIIWTFDPQGIPFYDSGKMSGSFDCKIYDLTYLYE